MNRQDYISRCVIALISVSFFAYPCFSFAQITSTPPVDTTTLIRQLQSLVASLQKQIQDLQTQLKATRGEIETVKTEIKELKLTRSLQRGVTGNDVRQLQEFLSSQYPDLYPTKQITGFFGPATEAAIKKLQEQNGIESLGIVGPKTIARIKELVTFSFAKVSREDKEDAEKFGKIPPGLLFHTPGLQSTTTKATTTPSGKLIICHIPPGNPENKQTIEIDQSALPSHLAHGDTIGVCIYTPTQTPPPTATTTAETPPPPTPMSSSSPSSLSSIYKWSFSAKTNMLSSPAIGSDGIIYVMDGKLFAITPTGNQKWVFSEEIHMGNSSPAIGSDGTIYINTHGPHKVYAINPNGTKKWEFFTSEVDTICCTPSLGQDGTIYITQYSRSGKLYALHPDGTQKWVFSPDTGISFYESAVGRDGTIYVRASGKLYAINPDGTKKFSIDITITSAPAIGADNTIYFQGGNTLYAFNPDGTQKWAFLPDGKPFLNESSVIGPDGTIYARTSECSHFGSLEGCIENLYAVNPDGTKKWLFTSLANEYSESSPAIGTNGVIYIGSGSNKFYAINPDGTKKWDFQTNSAIDSIRSSPALASDGTVYFSTFWGKYLYALSGESAGLANASWPKFRSNNKNTGLVASATPSLQTPTPTPSLGVTPPTTTPPPSMGTSTTTTPTPPPPTPSPNPTPTPPPSTATTSVSYDFAFSNDGPKSVTQGSSVSATISSSITSGSYDSSYLIMFSASNVIGLSTYFSPAGCVVPCTGTFNISTSATTTPGIYSVVIIATRGSVSRTTTVVVTVIAPLQSSESAPTQITATAVNVGDYSSSLGGPTIQPNVKFNYSVKTTTQSFNIYYKKSGDATFTKYTFDANISANVFSYSQGTYLYRYTYPNSGWPLEWSWGGIPTLSQSTQLGQYQAYVTVTDKNGIEGAPSATVSFEIYAEPTIVNPLNGSTISGPIAPVFSINGTPASDYALNYFSVGRKNLYGFVWWCCMWSTGPVGTSIQGPILNPNTDPYKLTVYSKRTQDGVDVSRPAVITFNVATTTSSINPDISSRLAQILESLNKILNYLKSLQ